MQRLKPTPQSPIGYFFPTQFVSSFRSSLVRPHKDSIHQALGKEILIKGCVLDENDQLVKDCILEFWQADANGVRVNEEGCDPWFDGFARLKVENGMFELHTIKPASWQQRAPHITVNILAANTQPKTTQLFFADEVQSNQHDALLQSLSTEQQAHLTAQHYGCQGNGIEVYALELRLSGEHVTPSFVGDEGSTLQPAMRFSAFPAIRSHEKDLSRLYADAPVAEGEVIEIQGQLLRQDTQPIVNALIEIWQPDFYGCYNHIKNYSGKNVDRYFAGMGRVITDKQGCFSFKTIKPECHQQSSPDNQVSRTGIHLSVLGDQTRLITTVYLSDDPYAQWVASESQAYLILDSHSIKCYQFTINCGF